MKFLADGDHLSNAAFNNWICLCPGNPIIRILLQDSHISVLVGMVFTATLYIFRIYSCYLHLFSSSTDEIIKT